MTTIRGINMPSLRKSGYVYACMRSSTTVTNVAMIITKHAILTLDGITFRNEETSILEQTKTKAVASPIPIPFSTVVVTASTGQRPSTSRKGGISFHRPLTNS